jgi:lipoprotein LpqH
VTFVVNGTPRPVQNTAQCKAAANWVIANLGSDQDGISVNLSAGAVQTLTLGTIEGVPVTYNDSQPGLKPTVTKTGSTYRIIGTATSPGADGTGTKSWPFDLEFTGPPGS